MQPITRTFYQYLGLHSLLIGIFPFFLPVFLWKNGFGLGEVSLFISAGGVGFCVGLWAWDRLRTRISLLQLIALSLLLEVMLLLNVLVIGMDINVLMLLGISYGIYNSFFWTTQRALFFERVNPTNSGRGYGSLQIFVGLLLQIGILIGGLLLEEKGLPTIVVASVVVCIAGLIMFIVTRPDTPVSLATFEPVSLRDVLTFSDNDSSRVVFIVDGIFLFLESFFWVISLFLLAHESFMTLGVLVLSLAVIFGLLFYLLKNSIDRLARKRVYRLAVVLYAMSWVLRALVGEDMPLTWLFVFLIVISFCTSFFRLAMNKRFYDLAEETLSHRYLILKSYFSQITIAIAFGAFGYIALGRISSDNLLIPVYWAAALGSLVFLVYGHARYDRVGAVSVTKTAS